MFQRVKEDIKVVFDRDPAAKSAIEIFTCYSGFHAIVFHRLTHLLWVNGFYWPARFCLKLLDFSLELKFILGLK